MTPTLTLADLERLREIAEKATPGEWRQVRANVWADALPHMAVASANILPKGKFANATHIAAFSPPTALALLAEALEGRERIAELEQESIDWKSAYEVGFVLRGEAAAALAVAQAKVEKMEAVVNAARKMPRLTPAPGGAGTEHPFKIAASTVWGLDAALTSLDERAALSPTPDGAGGGKAALPNTRVVTKEMVAELDEILFSPQAIKHAQEHAALFADEPGRWDGTERRKGERRKQDGGAADREDYWRWCDPVREGGGAPAREGTDRRHTPTEEGE